MARNTRHFSDLNLEFTIHPIKKDIAKLIDADAVKASVKALVLLNHYEKPFHPEIGSSVVQLLFENITPLTAINIQKAIQNVITNFEPRVTLQAVNVKVVPDQNGYQASIVYFVKNIPNPITIDFFLEQLR